MKKLTCPYCNTEIDTQDKICPNCNNSLEVLCPYCKQQIKSYEQICPYCSSNLTIKNNLSYLNALGILCSIIWTVINMLIIFYFFKHPEILFYKDKDGDSELIMTQYIINCLSFGIFVSLPYIINIIIKNKRKFAICAITINFILMFIFSYCAFYLKFR